MGDVRLANTIMVRMFKYIFKMLLEKKFLKRFLLRFPLKKFLLTGLKWNIHFVAQLKPKR